jgi:hypothetical protein
MLAVLLCLMATFSPSPALRAPSPLRGGEGVDSSSIFPLAPVSGERDRVRGPFGFALQSISVDLPSPALARGEPTLSWVVRNVDTTSNTTQADLFSPHGERAVVLLFVRSDCPISNRYAPELQRLYVRYSQQGVEFHLVYPELGLSAAAMEKHRKEYGFSIPALLDADHKYVDRAQVRVTPEAAVFVHGRLVYQGRVDDRFVNIGKSRSEATRRDLEEVLAALAAGKSLRRRETKAVGCVIEDLH